jgi:hypothetical protein
MLADGFPQFKQTQAVGIMSMSVVKGLAGSLLDTPGGVKIRFSDFKMNDVNPLALHLVGSLENVHHNKGCYFFGS